MKSGISEITIGIIVLLVALLTPASLLVYGGIGVIMITVGILIWNGKIVDLAKMVSKICMIMLSIYTIAYCVVCN